MTSDPKPINQPDHAPAGPAQPKPAAAGADGPARAGEVGTCPKCQHRNPRDVNFCQKCGAELSQPCPACNHANSFWAQHCGSCGVNLAEAKAAKEALERAHDHLSHRKYDDAIKAAERGLETRCLVNKLHEVLLEARYRAEHLAELRAQVPDLMDRQHYEDAERVLKEAIELDPSPTDLRTLLAELPAKIRQRAIETALETGMQAALRLDMNVAMDAVLRAFKLDNKDPRTRDMLAELTAKRDRLDAVYAQARRLREAKKPAEAAVLAQAVLREWDRADARQLLEQAQEAQSQLAAHLAQGEALFKGGQYKLAIQEFQSAQDIQPNPEQGQRISQAQAAMAGQQKRWMMLAAKLAAAAVVGIVLLLVMLWVGDHRTLNGVEEQLRAGQPDQALKQLQEARAVLFEGARSDRLAKEARDTIRERERLLDERENRPIVALLKQLQQGGRKPGQLIATPSGMKLAFIEPGEFRMGSRPTELDRSPDELQHPVRLTKAFMMGTTLVTQAQWLAVVGNNPSSFQGDNLPVENVSWNAAVEFCRKLSVKEKLSYRLPTEAEWEYACRAGTTTPFYFGDTISTDQANYDGASAYGTGQKGVSREKTTPVAAFPPNAWGLYDMHGNLWEWCGDWYGDYPDQAATDPAGPASGTSRVLRGGSWNNGPSNCRSAIRSSSVPEVWSSRFGFRIAMDLAE